jgi:opacity protein-like surface antigen
MQQIRKKMLHMLVVLTVLACQSHFSGFCGKEDFSSHSNAPGGAAGAGKAPPPPPPLPPLSPPKLDVSAASQPISFLESLRTSQSNLSTVEQDKTLVSEQTLQTGKMGLKKTGMLQISEQDSQTTETKEGKVTPDVVVQPEQPAPLPSLNQEAKTAILQGGTPLPPPPPPAPAAVPLSTTLNVKLSKPSQQNSSDSPKKLDPFQIAIANAIAKRAEKNPDVNFALRNIEQDRASKATSGDNKTPLTPKLREITKPDEKQTSSATSTSDILPKIMLKKINERFKEPDGKETPSGEEFTQLNESDSSEWQDEHIDNPTPSGAAPNPKPVKPAVSQTPPPVASRRNPATSQKSLSTKNQEAHKKPEAQRNAEQNERQQNYAKLKANDSPSDPPHRQHNGERASLPPTNGHASGAIPKKNNPEVPPKPKKVQQTSKPVEKVAPQISVPDPQITEIPQDLATQNQAGEPPKTGAEMLREALQSRRRGTNPDSAKKKRRRAEAEATERQRLEELQGQDSWDLPPLPQQQEPALENGDISPDTHSENGDAHLDTHSEDGDDHLDAHSEDGDDHLDAHSEDGNDHLDASSEDGDDHLDAHSEDGDDHLDASSENNDNPPEETQRVSTRRRHLNAALKGVSGDFFMGYGKQWGRVYLGLEASYLLSGEKGKLAIDLPVHKKDTLEVAFRPGIVVKRTLFYGKIGVANSRFKLSGEFQRFHGLSLGCGVDVKLSPWMLMGMGYTCIFYRKKTFFNQTVFTELKPRSHRLMLLRMAYTF